jgi:hypothetical protein
MVSFGGGAMTSKSKSPVIKEEFVLERVPVKTRITIHYDVGFGNALYIRGRGAGLSWDKGVPLKNAKADEWIWETSSPFSACEFKILLNDEIYEAGDNHPITQGTQLKYTPQF